MTGDAHIECRDGTAWFGAPVRQLVPLDADRAARELADLAEAATDAGLSKLAALASSEAPLARFLAAVLDLSPYVRDSLRRRPAILDALFGKTVVARISEICDTIRELPSSATETRPATSATVRVRLRISALMLDPRYPPPDTVDM